MTTMSVNKDGEVTFYPPDPARDDKFHVEFYQDCLRNVQELEKYGVGAFPPPSIITNLKIARFHCEERIKFYTHRPTVMRSG